MAQVSTLKIDSSKVSANLTDYPVYVNLSDMNEEFWNTVSNGGGDIRVFKSDGTTELPREVVSCNTSTETGELHFKYTGTLSSSTDTEVQIHADGTSSEPASGSTYGSEAVWSDYVAIYHLQSLAVDSTGNGNTLTNNNSVGSDVIQLGNCANFGTSNTNKYLSRSASVGGGGNKTISCWTRLNTEIASSSWGFYILSDATTDTSMYATYEYNSGTPRIVFYRARSGVAFGNESYNITLGTSNTYHIAQVYDGTTIKGYINSTERTSLIDSGNGTNNDVISGLKIGSIDNYTTGTPSSFASIDLDEFRVSTTALSSDWIETEYNNQNSPSTFYTVISVDSVGNSLFFGGGL